MVFKRTGRPEREIGAQANTTPGPSEQAAPADAIIRAEGVVKTYDTGTA